MIIHLKNTSTSVLKQTSWIIWHGHQKQSSLLHFFSHNTCCLEQPWSRIFELELSTSRTPWVRWIASPSLLLLDDPSLVTVLTFELELFLGFLFLTTLGLISLRSSSSFLLLQLLIPKALHNECINKIKPNKLKSHFNNYKKKHKY